MKANNARGDKLYVHVFNQIRNLIAERGLRTGDKLPTEQELCQMLGVSRNVVRESIKAMEIMGMVKSVAGRGCEIQEFSTEMLFESLFFFMGVSDPGLYFTILALRKKLELSYLEEAFYAIRDEDIREIRGVLSQCMHNWERNHFFHADDMRFHMAVFKPLKNRVLDSLLEAIWKVDEAFHPPRELSFEIQNIEKHENIVRALEEGSLEGFRQAMEEHFRTGKYAGVGDAGKDAGALPQAPLKGFIP